MTTITLVCRTDRGTVQRELPLTGPLADGYELVERLGAGGTGTVYRARRRATGEIVAVKVLNEPADAAQRARFTQEGQLLLALSDPHVVRVLDFGELAGHPFLVTAFLEGGSLRQRFAKHGALPLEEAVALIGDLLAGLEACHRRGVVHRDVKPENVFLEAGAGSARGRAVLGDLGAALDYGRQGAALTQAGSVVGTPAYMSPEQARGERAAVASDLYAAGLVLYEALAGEPAFAGEHALAILAAQREVEPAPLRVKRPELPAALTDLVGRALSKDPAGRPPSAEAFGIALRKALSARPASPPPASPAWGARAALAAGLAVALVAAVRVSAPPRAPSITRKSPDGTAGASASSPPASASYALSSASASPASPPAPRPVRPIPRALKFSRTFPAKREAELAPAKPLWERDLPGKIELDAVAQVGNEGPLITLCSGSAGATLVALDPASGTTRWTAPTSSTTATSPVSAPLPCAVAFGGPGRVALVAPGEDLAVLDLATGKLVKRLPLKHRPEAPRLLDVEHGTAHVGSAGGIVALSGVSSGFAFFGAVTQPGDPAVEAPSYPVPAGWRPITAGRGYAVLQDDALAVRFVELAPARTLWTQGLGVPLNCAKICMGDAAKVVMLCGDHLYVCSHPGGLLRRTADVGGPIERIIEEGGMLYLLHAPGHLSIVDYETFDPIFRFRDTAALGLLMATDVILSPGGRLRRLQPRSGAVQAEVQLGRPGSPQRRLLKHADRVFTVTALPSGATRLAAFDIP